MDAEQLAVLEFHKTFGIDIAKKPFIPSDEILDLRYELIAEELEEYEEAVENKDLVKIADALADLIYVIKGAGVSFGIDLELVFKEVHRSNMSKVGGHKRDDGKWVKPETYSPPDLKSIIDEQSK